MKIKPETIKEIAAVLILLIIGVSIPVVLSIIYEKEINIEIKKDNDFKKYKFPGNGSESNPYIIENLSIIRAKKRGISIYNLHVPLDNFGEYSTSVTLARALGIEVEKPFGSYYGALCGIIGKTNCDTGWELHDRYSEIIGHSVSLYDYGESHIRNNRVAITAGGGNILKILKEIDLEAINTYLTGITVKNEFSKDQINQIHAILTPMLIKLGYEDNADWTQ